MRMVIEFDENEEKEYIDYIKKLDKEDKKEIKDIAISAIMKHINEEFEREERAKERWAKLIKQEKCKHDFEEVERSRYDSFGDPYYDEDGEYMTAECVSYHCKKCDATTSKMEYRDPYDW
ncbi:hypothetical protein bcgnr5378_64370 [Bacillus cereus]|uniref:hypothetical protein n=1 Tax=Bacillus TaxID=1386 RepID=UPI001BB3E533|nr:MULTISPECIES: hypothetical protein [Bacillus]BCC09574.1 hypothetical protein BCM0060_p313 [Bacillus cereus]BCC50631.1 hypothetical protein BCJMU02_p328 [Bacillus cereus]HDR8026476.1 hypothetical protein [Bacillus cereus]